MTARRITIWLAATAALTGGASLALATPSPPPRPPEAVYAKVCGYCHGHNVGPVIRGRSLPPEMIRHLVRSGMGAMPPFRPTEITDAELAALADWISRSKSDPKEHGQ